MVLMFLRFWEGSLFSHAMCDELVNVGKRRHEDTCREIADISCA
jgi:hypothetical protein